MAKKAVKKVLKSVDFETSLAELENLVAQMEVGDISLDESLQHFERGILLTRQCQQALKNAEQKVQILLKDTKELAPFIETNDD